MADINIDEGLKLGLRNSTRNPRNSQMFTEFKNIIPMEYGARVYELIGDRHDTLSGEPLYVTIANSKPLFAWPFPQMFKGKKILLMAMNTALYTPAFDGTSWGQNDVSADELEIKKALDITSDFTIPTAAITHNALWHFVDFGDVWGLVRPNCTIFYSKAKSTTGQGADVIVGQGDDDAVYVTMRTACSFRGRSIAGGFDSAHFWSDDFKYIWKQWAAQQDIGVDFNFDDVDSNWVMWSNVGGGDLLWVFRPDYAYNPSGILSTYPEQVNPLEPQLFERLKSNEWGMMPMPWSGNVEVVKPLGDGVMVYGSNGISLLRPTQTPINTFGVVPIFDNLGVHGRGAVGGSEREHVFVDKKGAVWKIGTDYSPKLMYEEGMLFDTLGVISISHDPVENYYYLSRSPDTAPTGSYVITRTGMAFVYQCISSVFRHTGGLLYGTTKDGTGATANDLVLTTDIFDMGSRAIKNISNIEIGGIMSQFNPGVTALVQYRYDAHSSFTNSTPITISNEGIIPINVSGVDFKINITGTDHTKITSIDYIKVQFGLADRRHVRGTI